MCTNYILSVILKKKEKNWAVDDLENLRNERKRVNFRGKNNILKIWHSFLSIQCQ